MIGQPETGCYDTTGRDRVHVGHIVGHCRIGVVLDGQYLDERASLAFACRNLARLDLGGAQDGIVNIEHARALSMDMIQKTVSGSKRPECRVCAVLQNAANGL